MTNAPRQLVELYIRAGERGLLEVLRQRVAFFRGLFYLLSLSAVAAALLLFLSFGSSMLVPALIIVLLPAAIYWKYFPVVFRRELAALGAARAELVPEKRGDAGAGAVDPMVLLGYEGYIQALKEMVGRE